MLKVLRLAMILGTGLSIVGPARAADKVTLFQNLSPISGVTIVAHAKGFFREHGLDVDVRNVTAGKLALDAVLGDSAQFATVAETPIMRAALANQPVSIIATMEASDNDVRILVRNDRHIDSLKELKGKTIGTAVGTSAEYLVVAALKSAGLQPQDVKIINLRPQDMATALYRGDIDGYAIWQPHVYNGLKLMAGNAKELDTKGLYRETFEIVCLPSYAAKNPTVITRFLQALIEAETYIKQKPEETSAIIAAAMKMDDPTFLGIRSSFDYHVELDPSLVTLMQKEADWDASTGKAALVPNVPAALRKTVLAAPLKAIAPDRVKGF